ncbi:MAG: hypothetical protein AAF456_01345 [Planctomycetota bacterium]
MDWLSAIVPAASMLLVDLCRFEADGLACGCSMDSVFRDPVPGLVIYDRGRVVLSYHAAEKTLFHQVHFVRLSNMFVRHAIQFGY